MTTPATLSREPTGFLSPGWYLFLKLKSGWANHIELTCSTQLRLKDRVSALGIQGRSKKMFEEPQIPACVGLTD